MITISFRAGTKMVTVGTVLEPVGTTKKPALAEPSQANVCLWKQALKKASLEELHS